MIPKLNMCELKGSGKVSMNQSHAGAFRDMIENVGHKPNA